MSRWASRGSDRSRLPGRAHARPVWYAKYRLPDGRQVQKKLGPAWTRAGAAAGRLLHQAAGGGLAAATCSTRRARDAAGDGARPGRRSPTRRRSGCGSSRRTASASRRRSTDYRSALNAHLLPAFGAMPVEDDHGRGDRALASRRSTGSSNRTQEQAADPAARDLPAGAEGLRAAGRTRWRDVEKHPHARERRHRGVLARGGVGARAGGRVASRTRAIFLTAAFTGLRMGELLALRWRDVDFAGRDDPGARELRGRGADDAEVGQGAGGADGARRRRPRSLSSASARTGSARTTWCSPARPAATSTARRCAGATRPRWRRAGLRPLRFHDLRHTFGTRMIAKADIRRVQEWMGHADIQTTMQYLHYAPARRGRAAGRRGVSPCAARIRAVWAERPQDVRRCPKMSVRSVGRIACDGGGFDLAGTSGRRQSGRVADVCQRF